MGVLQAFPFLLFFVSLWVFFSQRRTNPAFSKPCLCLSDTRHFRHLRRFRGSEERSPCFQGVECKFVIFAVFVKTAPFWQGTKTRFTKNEKVGFGVIFLCFRYFWAIFSPFRAAGQFLFLGQFFPIFGFRPGSILYQAA